MKRVMCVFLGSIVLIMRGVSLLATVDDGTLFY